jgi:hypothetical protein
MSDRNVHARLTEEQARQALHQAVEGVHLRPGSWEAVPRRQRRQRRRRVLTVAAYLAIVLAVAGAVTPAVWERLAAGGPTAPPSRGHRYQTTATVLQSRDHGPELCLTGMAGVLPACRGLPITNWRWDQVGGEQTAHGITWGSYHLVGTYNGHSFTVIRAGLAPPVRQPSAAEQFKDEPKSPCPEPEGGWPVPDPARRSERYLEPVTRMARAQPDFAGVWLSYLEPMGHNVAEDPGEFVLNVAFTGELARHEAQLRSRWGGRLCVTRQQRTYRELLRIQRELHGAAGTELGLRVLSSGIDESANAVSLEVLVLEERAREALDARFGAGAVQATARLTPVS